MFNEQLFGRRYWNKLLNGKFKEYRYLVELKKNRYLEEIRMIVMVPMVEQERIPLPLVVEPIIQLLNSPYKIKFNETKFNVNVDKKDTVITTDETGKATHTFSNEHVKCRTESEPCGLFASRYAVVTPVNSELGEVQETYRFQVQQSFCLSFG